MARRKDHTHAQLRDMILAEGHRHMAEVGYARFSAREVARKIGYSLGTLYNVVGDHDALVAAINTLTFVQWAADVEKALERAPDDRIRALVHAYFTFARDNRNLWTSIYDHRLAPGTSLPPEQDDTRGRLTAIIVREVSMALPERPDERIASLSRSLIATVHGHCDLAISGSLALMGETDPEGAALDRVRDSIEIARNRN